MQFLVASVAVFVAAAVRGVDVV